MVRCLNFQKIGPSVRHGKGIVSGIVCGCAQKRRREDGGGGQRTVLLRKGQRAVEGNGDAL